MGLSINPRKFTGYLIGLVVALSIVEVGLRFIEATPLWRALPVIEPILGQPDYDIGYKFTPGVEGTWVRENRSKIRINSLGLRDFEISQKKPPGVFRVVLTGDSMVEALQVDQNYTFDNIAERKLSQDGLHVEIANLGMSGNGPLRQLVRLENFGYPLEPDLAILYASAGDFLTGELLRDVQNPGYVATSDGNLERGYAFRDRWQIRHADSFLGRSFIALLQHSSVFRMLYLRSRDPWQQVLGLSTAHPSSKMSPDLCWTSMIEPLDKLWNSRTPDVHWQATNRFLDDLADSTSKHKLPVVFLMADIPVPQVSCTAAINMRQRVITKMSKAFESRGLKFVDWNEALLKSGAIRDPADLQGLKGFGSKGSGGHLNYRGHEVFATALSDFIVRYKPMVAPVSDLKQ